MARTTSGAVQGILMADYDSANAPSLTPFIDTASSIVDDVAICATNKGKSLTAGKLELIERWLAAHCYCASDQPYSERATEKAKGVFQGQTGMNLDGTKYGQMAKSLDPTGCLAAVTSTYKPGLMWLGKPPSQQIDYNQRD